jgi:uncharacterized protein YunC (DUF1805 family)
MVCPGGVSIETKIRLKHGEAEGYVVELGPVNLVFAKAAAGMVACGAVDVQVLEKFHYPAARAGSLTGGPIATIDDLLKAVVKEANASAVKTGVLAGMTGFEALEILSGKQ